MAGRGPTPKDQRARTRDTKAKVSYVDDGTVYGSPLPAHIPDPASKEEGAILQWHPMTVAWWEGMRTWPAMKDAHTTWWNALVATALMHHQMWSNGRWDFAAEIRLREAKFGVTPLDEKSLGIERTMPDGAELDAGGQPKLASVSSIGSRRERLAGTPVKQAPARKRPAKKAVAKKAPEKKAAQPDAPPF